MLCFHTYKSTYNHGTKKKKKGCCGLWPVSGVSLPLLSPSEASPPQLFSPPPPAFSSPLPDTGPPLLSSLALPLYGGPSPPLLIWAERNKWCWCKSTYIIGGTTRCPQRAFVPRLLLLLPPLLLLSLPLLPGQPPVFGQDPTSLLWICGTSWKFLSWRTACRL